MLTRIVPLLAFSLCIGTSINAQTPDLKEVAVEGGRPVAKAVETLTNTYKSVVVTYEDPPYSYDGDIDDVTSEVRRDIRKFAPGAAPRVLVPRGGSLSAAYTVAVAKNQPADWGNALQSIVNAPVTSGGRFRVENDGDVFHIVPAQVRDASGRWIAVSSILDHRISISPKVDANGLDLLVAITNAVSERIGVKVNVGTIPVNLFMGYEAGLDASDLTARDALLRLFEATGAKLRWQLFYGPDVKQYALNISFAAPMTAPIPQPLPSPRLGGPSPSPLLTEEKD